jgi:hypothetical protein
MVHRHLRLLVSLVFNRLVRIKRTDSEKSFFFTVLKLSSLGIVVLKEAHIRLTIEFSELLSSLLQFSVYEV